MTILIIIPARIGSIRLPEKPLIDLLGKSLIQRVYERIFSITKELNSSFTILPPLIATDSQKIIEHVRLFGGEAVLTDPAHQSGTDRCAEAVEIKLKEGQISEENLIVINVQGDEPFAEKEHLRTLIKQFDNSTVAIATIAKLINTSSDIFDVNKPKLTISNSGKALYFSRSPIPFVRDEEPDYWLAEERRFYKHIGMYAFRWGTLEELVKLPSTELEKTEKLEQLRWLENDYDIQVGIVEKDTFGIDTPTDVAKAIARLKMLQKQSNTPCD